MHSAADTDKSASSNDCVDVFGRGRHSATSGSHNISDQEEISAPEDVTETADGGRHNCGAKCLGCNHPGVAAIGANIIVDSRQDGRGHGQHKDVGHVAQLERCDS
jgi:hypothetical protein